MVRWRRCGRMISTWIVACLVAAVAPILLPAAAAMADADSALSHCAALSGQGTSDRTITSAQRIEAGAGFAPDAAMGPVGRAFCRVEGHIEDEIGFELWLPERDAWNGRLLTGGVGGQAGAFNVQILVRGVRRGYATASTDAGHKAADTHWLLGQRAAAPPTMPSAPITCWRSMRGN